MGPQEAEMAQHDLCLGWLIFQWIGIVPDHDGGRPMEVNACILITHMVYL
jgi:hypothetical protein